MKLKIIKATQDQKDNYAEVGKCYPLFGYITVRGVVLVIEDLKEWKKPDPQYEVMAPEGFIFAGVACHSLLCHDYTDIKERVSAYELVKCECADAGCDVYWAEQNKPK